MIHRISSTLPSFKTLSFNPGLNVLLADKCAGATDRQSRNGAGKSSLIDLIHFLFGSTVDQASIFRNSVLVEHDFDAEISISSKNLMVQRRGNKPSKVRLFGELEGILRPQYGLDPSIGQEISNDEWCDILATSWFGLPKFFGEDLPTRFRPTMRMLFPYFVRRQGVGGFQDHQKQCEKQQPWDSQVALSYLIGLDWELPQRFQILREKEKIVKTLKKAAKQGDLGNFLEPASSLRSKLAIAEEVHAKSHERLANFNIVEDYIELEKEANNLTRSISDLNNANVLDKRLLSQLKDCIASEKVSSLDHLKRIYDEAGVSFSGEALRRFDEVEKFHIKIINNRRNHLLSEITEIDSRLSKRRVDVLKIESRRREVMAILKSGGALDQYTLLREELARLKSSVEDLRHKLELSEQIERNKADFDIERAQLLRDMKNDIYERGSLVRDAVVIFERLSEALYTRAGILRIDDTPSGPTFDIKIDGQRSKGISNMQIFCFDLMLMELMKARGFGLDFLVHDSHLFDGVDERQIANALQVGAERASSVGFQYIVTMNSDILPRKGYREDFSIGDYVLPVKLTDDTETGGLFGIRF